MIFAIHASQRRGKDKSNLRVESWKRESKSEVHADLPKVNFTLLKTCANYIFINVPFALLH